MIAYAMQHEGVDLFTSAADCITLDGHVANKVGTLQIAILAKYFGLPYYVTGAPDAGKRGADDIVIEMRDPGQVLSYREYAQPLTASRPYTRPLTSRRRTSFPES